MPGMRGDRARGRSCPSRHGDGKCELSGWVGPAERAEETRRWHRDVAPEVLDVLDPDPLTPPEWRSWWFCNIRVIGW